MKRKKEAKKERNGMGFAHGSFFVGFAPLYPDKTKVWASPMGCFVLGFKRHRYQSIFIQK